LSAPDARRTSAPVDPTARNFHPATDTFVGAAQFGELAPADTEWLAQSSGFVTETQTFYNFLEDGGFIMCQVIHSSTGCAIRVCTPIGR
jgi:hypothetical protein